MNTISMFSRQHTKFEVILRLLGQMGYLLIVLSPIIGLVWTSDKSPSMLLLELPGSRRLLLLGYSLGLAGSVALLGTCVALSSAGAPHLQYGRSASWIRGLLLAAAALPPYLHAMAWNSLLDHLGVSYQNGWFITIWVQTMAFLPLALFIIQTGLRHVSDDLVAAARIQQPAESVLFRIILPLTSPWIRASASILFLLSLLDYSVPYLFGKSVYALEIFADFGISNQPIQVLWIALPLIILAFLALISALSGLRAISNPAQHRQDQSMMLMPLSGWLRRVQTVALGLTFLSIGAPIIGLLILVESPAALFASINSGIREAGFSLAVTLIVSVACLPLALAASQGISTPGRAQATWWLLSLSALTLPPALVGIGLESLLSHPPFTILYGNDAGLLLGYLARFTPLAALVLASQVYRQDRLLLDASLVFQRDVLWGWFKVRLPLQIPGLAAAASLVGILSAGELALTVILVPPGRSTLTLRIFNFMHYGSPEAVAGLSLILIALACGTGLLVTNFIQVSAISHESETE